MNIYALQQRYSVDPARESMSNGLQVVELELDSNMCGYQECMTILINNTMSSIRKRWCIAYLLSRIYLNSSNYEPVVLSDFSKECGSEENYLSMAILMPSSSVNTVIEKHGVTSITDLAFIFCVSKLAIVERLKQLHWL